MSEILIIDSTKLIPKRLESLLQKDGHKTQHLKKIDAGLTALRDKTFDLVLINFESKVDLTTVKKLKEQQPELPFIITSKDSSSKTIVKSLKIGVKDYITKPYQAEDILDSIKNTIKQKTSPKKDYVKGISNFALQLEKHINLIAPTDLSLIILGETGTGKEYVAREIHRKSLRAKKPFIAVDCGALTNELATSTFFGHEKGAFTGAHEKRKGCFELANNGTLFLDELENLSYENQIKLLRTLQEEEVKRIGSSKSTPINVRIIVASNQQLKKGLFREDLYYRINEFSITLQPLRKRKSDIQIFANYFLKQANKKLNKNLKGFSNEAIHALNKYPFPGNIRELGNLIRRAGLLSLTDTIEINDLPEEVINVKNTIEEEENDLKLENLLAKTECKAIKKALKVSNKNKSQAARILGITRKTLYSKMKEYNLSQV